MDFYLHECLSTLPTSWHYHSRNLVASICPTLSGQIDTAIGPGLLYSANKFWFPTSRFSCSSHQKGLLLSQHH